MKKNFNHITMILILACSYNVQALTVASPYTYRTTTQKFYDEEDLTRKADAEIEDLLINSEIPTPTFKSPALWEVLIRQYGIKLFYTCYNFKTWLVQAYYNIKEVVYETSIKNETI